jgi:hypothetical protein
MSYMLYLTSIGGFPKCYLPNKGLIYVDTIFCLLSSKMIILLWHEKTLKWVFEHKQVFVKVVTVCINVGGLRRFASFELDYSDGSRFYRSSKLRDLTSLIYTQWKLITIKTKF